MAATDSAEAPGATENARPQLAFRPEVARTMKAAGDTGKDGEKKTTPSDKTAASDQERRDKGTADQKPPSESERAAAAKSNPLRTPADDEHAGPTENGEKENGEKTSQEEDTGESKPSAEPAAGSSGGAPELRISARMLSAQPPANTNTKTNTEPQDQPPPTAGKAKHRRRVKSLAQPIEPEVINPLRLLWPRANSRRSARIASRYGFVGFIVALIWIGVALPANTVNNALSFSSSATAVAVVVVAIAALCLIIAAYYQQSRLAALLSLIGVVTLIVLDHQAEPNSWVETAGQIALVYLMLHGVHGTIAYHIFGRRKRRRSSGYRYKGYRD